MPTVSYENGETTLPRMDVSGTRDLVEWSPLRVV